MMPFLSKVLRNVGRRIEKQKHRKNLYLSEDLYLDTFNASEGNLKMYSISGGEIYLWINIEIDVARRLLSSIYDAFFRNSDITNVKSAQCDFYIKSNKGEVVLEIVLSGVFYLTGSQSITIDRYMLENSIKEMQCL